MNRRCFLWLFAALVAIPLLAKGSFGFAPQKGFVFVRTQVQPGMPAPYTEITVRKLSGNYPVPPGPYITNGVGQIWIALYPGTYRFSVTAGGATPTYWDVGVASMGEYYIFFNVSAPEETPKSARDDPGACDAGAPDPRAHDAGASDPTRPAMRELERSS